MTSALRSSAVIAPLCIAAGFGSDFANGGAAPLTS